MAKVEIRNNTLYVNGTNITLKVALGRVARFARGPLGAAYVGLTGGGCVVWAPASEPVYLPAPPRGSGWRVYEGEEAVKALLALANK